MEESVEETNLNPSGLKKHFLTTIGISTVFLSLMLSFVTTVPLPEDQASNQTTHPFWGDRSGSLIQLFESCTDSVLIENGYKWQ